MKMKKKKNKTMKVMLRRKEEMATIEKSVWIHEWDI